MRAFSDRALFPEHVRIKHVSCGADHTVAVDDTGNLYTWGLGNFGNLGHGDTEDQPVPRIVDGLRGAMVTMVRSLPPGPTRAAHP